jgi:hypothetical protein
VKRTRSSAVLAVAAVLALAGCDVGRLNFEQDHRLHFEQPADRSDVRLPFTLRWRFAGAPPAGYAVLLDQSPPPPGKTLAWIVRHDRGCTPAAGCPNPAYLAGRGAYRTSGPALTLRAVTKDRVIHNGSEHHTATVVLLDAAGRRVGESFWSREFVLRRAP